MRGANAQSSTSKVLEIKQYVNYWSLQLKENCLRKKHNELGLNGSKNLRYTYAGAIDTVWGF